MMTVIYKRVLWFLFLINLTFHSFAHRLTETKIHKTLLSTRLDTDPFENKPLHLAILDNNTELTKKIIKNGANLSACNIGQQTPLHLAVIVGNLQIIQLLIENGADLEAKADYGLTPLHFAAERNQRYCLELLLLFGADVTAKTDTQKTAYDLANEKNNLPLFYFLKEEWLEKSHQTNCRRLREIGKKLDKSFGEIPYYFNSRGPCEEIAKYLTVKETYKALGRL